MKNTQASFNHGYVVFRMSVGMTDASFRFLYLVNSDGCNRQLPGSIG